VKKGVGFMPAPFVFCNRFGKGVRREETCAFFVPTNVQPLTKAKTSKAQRRKVKPMLGTREPKRWGEVGELALMHIASLLGFSVLKPHGDSLRYDFVFDSGRRLWRIQVKSTWVKGVRGYSISATWHSSHRIVPYDSLDIDFLIAYLQPEEAWYIIPVSAFAPRKRLRFYPEGCNPRARYEKYRDAWCQLACRREGCFDNLPVKPRCQECGECAFK
jgi:hypothetical protein